MNKKTIVTLATIAIVAACATQSDDAIEASENDETGLLFVESKNVIPFEERSRRKWDSPIIADLDQDGWMDLITTEHGHRVNIYWNEGGEFSQAEMLIGGDTHGIAVSDYNRDGIVDVIVSQGGGGGLNPRQPVVFHVDKERNITPGGEFSHFERTRGRAVNLFDANNNGVLELLLTGFPLKIQEDGANHFYTNDMASGFKFYTLLPQAKWLGYRSRVTDYNMDGDADLIFYGGANMVLVSGQNGYSFADVTEDVLGEYANIAEVSSITEIDFDNDGDLDLFLSRAEHQFEEETYYDPQAKRFAFFARNQSFQYDDIRIDGDMIYENLQMAYPDFDVFIGRDMHKLEFTVDRHGHKDFVVSQSDAEGWPEELPERGLYIGHMGEGVWRVGGYTKSPTTGVIHNVLSAPAPLADEPFPAMMLENQNGRFVDATSRLGIAINEQTTNSVMGDFDNDGWSDLFVIKYGNPAKSTEQILLINQEGKGFVESGDHGLISWELGATGSGGAAFDYDQDGDLDIVYANERGRWHLFTNTSSANSTHNYASFDIGLSPNANVSATGAVLKVEACDQTYIRRVGAASSAFSQGANTHLHIGLGNCEFISSADVTWSNGERQTVSVEHLNEMIRVPRQ